jgi:hypothetical protein
MEKTAAKADVKADKAAGETKVAKHTKRAKGKKAKA